MIKNYKPFDNAEEVWFWFCNSMIARGDGFRKRSDYSGEPREIEVSDIYKIIKQMKFNNQIGNRELRTVTRWGCAGSPPYYDKRAKISEIKLWEYFMKTFEHYLKFKGIV